MTQGKIKRLVAEKGFGFMLPKPTIEREVLEAIHSVLDRANGRAASGINGPLAGLSDEECQLLRAVGLGTLNKQIARGMKVSLRTVQFRRAALMQKLGARTRADLIRLAVESGLCD
jgi:FixJ family two-component response regulator